MSNLSSFLNDFRTKVHMSIITSSENEANKEMFKTLNKYLIDLNVFILTDDFEGWLTHCYSHLMPRIENYLCKLASLTLSEDLQNDSNFILRYCLEILCYMDCNFSELPPCEGPLNTLINLQKRLKTLILKS